MTESVPGPRVVDPAIFELPASERLPEWAQGMVSALDDRMGVVVGQLSAERCIARAPVEGNTQPFGLWHGGASGVLVELTGSLVANAWARDFGRAAVGVDLNVTHHRAVRRGHVTAVATPLRQGRTVGSYQVSLHDDAGGLVATGRLTCQFVAGPPA